MLRDYELMYIVRPDLDDEAVRAAMKSVETAITGQGGSVVKTTSWGKRRLAYEIDRLRDGHYVLLQTRLDGTRIKELDQALRISDSVFRHMIVLAHEPFAEEAVESGADGAAEDGGEPRAEAGGAAAERPEAAAGAEADAEEERIEELELDAADEDEEEF